MRQLYQLEPTEMRREMGSPVPQAILGSAPLPIERYGRPSPPQGCVSPRRRRAAMPRTVARVEVRGTTVSRTWVARSRIPSMTVDDR